MKILFTPMGGSLAHTVRCLAVADELKARGHSIFFTSCDTKDVFIKEQGYPVVKTYPTVSFTDPEDQSLNYIESNQEKFLKWFQADIDAVKEVKPDVVVSAPGFLGPHTYFATGVRTVAILDAIYLSASKGLLGLSLSSDSCKHKIMRTLLKPLFIKAFTKQYLQEILKIYDLLGIKNDIQNREDLYGPFEVIIPSDDILEPLNCKSSQITHVGPIFWSQFEEDTSLTDEFLKEFKGNNLLIFTAFGGSVHDKKIYDRVLGPLHDLKYKVIVGIGPNWQRSDFPDDSDRLIYRKYVPGLRVSKHADVVINTGAQGSVSQALTYGKPQVAFPTNIDQAYYANRLEELGIGINVNKVGILDFSKRESYAEFPETVSDKILEGIHTILNDDSYRENAVRFSEYLQKYNNPIKVAANIIERKGGEVCS